MCIEPPLPYFNDFTHHFVLPPSLKQFCVGRLTCDSSSSGVHAYPATEGPAHSQFHIVIFASSWRRMMAPHRWQADQLSLGALVSSFSFSGAIAGPLESRRHRSSLAKFGEDVVSILDDGVTG